MTAITCIIPTRGNRTTLPLLKRCVQSLRFAEKSGTKLYIVIVSDNNSVRTHLLTERINNFFPVHATAGFSEKNNFGIKETIRLVPSDYYLFINDDAWVNENFFTQFLIVQKHHNPDVLNPLVYKADTPVIDSFGVEYFTSGYAKNSLSFNTKTTLATAACMVIHTTFLQKLNKRYGFYFNPLLYYYLDDVEFSIRALGIGGKIEKSEKLIAYHIGSHTSGFRSKFTMYQTYRNLLWVIILTWPAQTIVKNFGNILLIQLWVLSVSSMRFWPLLYVNILYETLLRLYVLLKYRSIILKGYIKSFRMNSVFSRYRFRTARGFAL